MSPVPGYHPPTRGLNAQPRRCYNLRVRRAAVLGIVWLFAPSAAAQDDEAVPSSVSLAWSAPAGCPESEAVREAIVDRLGRDPFGAPDTTDVDLSGTVEALPEGGHRVRLVLAGADGTPLGERELLADSDRCGEVLDGTSLVAAMMIEAPRPRATFTLPPPAPPPEPAPRPAPPEPEEAPAPEEAPPPVVTEPPAPEPPGPALRLASRLGPTLALGPTPDPSAGLRAELGLGADALPWFELGVGAHLAVERERGGRGATFQLVTVEVAVCPRLLHEGPLDLDVCGAFALELVWARGIGLDENLDTLDAVPAPGARLRLALELARPVYLVLDGGPYVPLVRYAYSFDTTTGAEDVFEVSPILGRVTLALALRFSS